MACALLLTWRLHRVGVTPCKPSCSTPLDCVLDTAKSPADFKQQLFEATLVENPRETQRLGGAPTPPCYFTHRHLVRRPSLKLCMRPEVCLSPRLRCSVQCMWHPKGWHHIHPVPRRRVGPLVVPPHCTLQAVSRDCVSHDSGSSLSAASLCSNMTWQATCTGDQQQLPHVVDSTTSLQTLGDPCGVLRVCGSVGCIEWH